jgi:hypothetical protein
MKAVLVPIWRVASIIFAQLGGSWRVYAFEADQTNYTCAKINVEVAERVMVWKISRCSALWSHNRGVLFSDQGAIGSSPLTINRGRTGK